MIYFVIRCSRNKQTRAIHTTHTYYLYATNMSYASYKLSLNHMHRMTLYSSTIDRKVNTPDIRCYTSKYNLRTQ